MNLPIQLAGTQRQVRRELEAEERMRQMVDEVNLTGRQVLLDWSLSRLRADDVERAALRWRLPPGVTLPVGARAAGGSGAADVVSVNWESEVRMSEL